MPNKVDAQYGRATITLCKYIFSSSHWCSFNEKRDATGCHRVVCENDVEMSAQLKGQIGSFWARL